LYSQIDNKTASVIKNVISYKISGSKVIWFSADGFLYSSDLSGKTASKLTNKEIKVSPNSKIYVFSGKTFLQVDNSFLALSSDAKTLRDISPPETNYKVLSSTSDNGNLNLIFWNAEKIYLYSFADKKFWQIYSGKGITDCQMINNNYIVFAQESEVLISEMDYRGNINAVILPKTATIKSNINKSISIASPKIFFNQQDGKIYLLTNNYLLSSDKITP